MRAAWYCGNGAPRDVLVVGELPKPSPGEGEVLVRVAASGVNPSDVKGMRGRPLNAALVIPHSDGAGVIEAVGPGVDPARVGSRVWLWNGQWQRPNGTAAEYIALPQDQAVPLPEQLEMAAGACLGIPAMTAYHAVSQLGALSGRSVLVVGAASAVGDYAAQMAALRGARVIGTVGSDEKAAHALGANVSATIDYKREPVAERVKALTGGRGVDGIIDMDFSTTAPLLSAGVLASHGTLVSYGSNAYTDIPVPFRSLLFASVTLRFFLVYELLPSERQAAIAGLSELLRDGRLRHTVAGRWAHDDIASAHEAVERGQLIGNVVVELP